MMRTWQTLVGRPRLNPKLEPLKAGYFFSGVRTEGHSNPTLLPFVAKDIPRRPLLAAKTAS